MKKSKILMFGKIIWTIISILFITLTIIEMWQGDYSGINFYILTFQVFILLKFWHNKIDIIDAFIITFLEAGLCLRYIIKNFYYLELQDIIVISTQILPIILSWSIFLIIRKDKEKCLSM